MDSVNRTPRARILHQCDCCFGRIWPGETYRRESCFNDGSAWTWKTCAECDEVADAVWGYAIDTCTGISDEDYLAWAEDNEHSSAEARAYLRRCEYGRPEPEREAT